MRAFIFLLIAASTFSKAHAQGCVAIRSNGGVCTISDPSHNTKQSGWVLGLNSRYFKSFRHFSAAEEQKQRLEERTEVINHFFLPISASRASSMPAGLWLFMFL